MWHLVTDQSGVKLHGFQFGVLPLERSWLLAVVKSGPSFRRRKVRDSASTTVTTPKDPSLDVRTQPKRKQKKMPAKTRVLLGVWRAPGEEGTTHLIPATTNHHALRRPSEAAAAARGRECSVSAPRLDEGRQLGFAFPLPEPEGKGNTVSLTTSMEGGDTQQRKRPKGAW